MAADLQVLVEYRIDGEWRLLGTYHPGRDARIMKLIGDPAGLPSAVEPPLIEPRGLPDPCAFDTWLATQRTQGSSGQLGVGDTATVRLGRMVGANVSRLVAPAGGIVTWLNARDLRKVLKKHGAPGATWKALLALLEGLPDGRMVGRFV